MTHPNARCACCGRTRTTCDEMQTNPRNRGCCVHCEGNGHDAPHRH